MFKNLGYIDGRLLFMHFRIHDESLDVGLLPLMCDKYVIRFLEYFPRFKEVEVYVKISVSLVVRHMMKRMTSKGKGVVIEETVDHDVNDAIGKEFDVESGTSFPPQWSVELMIANKTKRMSDEFKFRLLLTEIDNEFGLENSSQDSLEFPNEVNFDDVVDEPEEIIDMVAILDKAMDELDQVIEAENVVDGDDGEQVVYDRDVIPDRLYAAIVAQKGVFSTDDEDVIPYEVVDEVLKQKGVWLVDDGDVIPDEVVVEKMLEDHTRLIKRKRVMVDKENEDDSQ
ncbi:hypothetical protein Tco_0959523 [Tanacetum coccineum]